MRSDARLMRHACALAGLLLCVLCAGCETLGSSAPPPPPRPDPAAIEAAVVKGHLDALQHLFQAAPADQSTLVGAAQADFESNPSPSRQLRYALMLAVPGLATSNPAKAAQLLQPLASATGALTEQEQALAMIALQNVELNLTLSADNQKLQGQLQDHNEHERFVANSRRLQTELDENARLRKDLEEARTKLDAIANIERGAAKPVPRPEGAQ